MLSQDVNDSRLTGEVETMRNEGIGKEALRLPNNPFELVRRYLDRQHPRPSQEALGMAE